MEKRIRVGCYGAKGSYTYEAMERHFGEREREEIYFPLFEDVTKAAAGGMIDYGVVPIENSSTGGITEVYDLIRGCGCAIVGEELVKIEHHLLGLPGAEMEDIDTVYSHPQGFAQCRLFFNDHRDWKLKPYFSTSQSAERVSKDGKKNQAETLLYLPENGEIEMINLKTGERKTVGQKKEEQKQEESIKEEEQS